MPNRIIKDSILNRDEVANLSDFEFRLFIGLVLFADESGCNDARAAIIKGRVFPLLDEVTADTVEIGMNGLIQNDIISVFYSDHGTRFKIVDWETMFPEAGRKTSEYSEWRKAVFERDNYTCRMCGKRGGKLNAHHIKRYRYCVADRTNIDNGITLCEGCHREVHHKEGK